MDIVFLKTYKKEGSGRVGGYKFDANKQRYVKCKRKRGKVRRHEGNK